MTAQDNVPCFPFDRPSVLDTAPESRRLQENGRIIRVRTPTGDPAWLVSRYDQVRALFADERLGRSHPEPQQAPRLSDNPVLGGPLPSSSYAAEKDEHLRMRRAFMSAVSSRRVQLLRPLVQDVVTAALNNLTRTGPGADFHELFSVPVPVLAVCDLLGVPTADSDDFRRWTADTQDLADPSRTRAGWTALRRYLRQLLERKRQNPADDVISDLLASAPDGRPLSTSELIMAGVVLLMGGYMTTVTRLDLGMALLLAHPEQCDRLRREPELAPAAVEEILRLAAPSRTGVQLRYAKCEVAVADVVIRPGELVLLDLQSANRDPAVFPDPDRLDLTRPRSAHLAFGHGDRFCVGAGLARLEMQIAFSAICQRLPDLRLAVPVTELRLLKDDRVGGLESLPVTW